MKSRLIFQNHICIQLIGISRFFGCKNGLVLIIEDLRAIRGQQTLRRPVVLIFLHIESILAGLIMNGLGGSAHLFPCLWRILRIQTSRSEQIRVVINDRRTDREREPYLFIAHLRQFQDIWQKALFDKILIFFRRFFQICRSDILEVLIKILQIIVPDHGNRRRFAGSHIGLQILHQSRIHVRIIHFLDDDLILRLIEIIDHLFNDRCTKVFGIHMPECNDRFPIFFNSRLIL